MYWIEVFISVADSEMKMFTCYPPCCPGDAEWFAALRESPLKTQNIFYGTRKKITQSFTVNDPKTSGSNKQQINGTLPIIALGKNNYYYIKGEWYGSGYGDNLFKGYYK